MSKKLDDFLGLEDHARCYLLFLIAVILLLVTKDFGGNQKVFDYLAFGLTITSFFLSVFAIFYSMLGETKTAGILNSIETAAKHLESTASAVTAEIQRQSGTLSDLKAGQDRVADSLLKTTREKEKAEPSVSQEAIADNSKSLGSQEGTYKFKDLYATISLSGLVLLYAVSLSWEKHVPFAAENIKRGENDENLFSWEYIQGMLVGLASVGVVDFSEKDRIIQIRTLNAVITSKRTEKMIETRLKVLISEVPENDTDEKSFYEGIAGDIRSDIEILRKYFS